MPLELVGRRIGRVTIVDDDAEARAGYSYAIEDIDAEAVPVTGQFDDVEAMLKTVKTSGDAVLCDYHLSKHNYATFNGDDFVARCYEEKIPAVLCTTYADAEVTLNRRARRHIPVFLKTADLDPDSIKRGFQLCIDEFAGRFLPSRQSARTLVRIDSVEEKDGYSYVVVPAWDDKIKIRINFDELPAQIKHRIVPDARFHAKVNVDAENPDELFFDDWEPR